jgi:(R,R)-butanediol dehydrogenase/meso-butanediol dehydrogenase/diacetyl reductase
MPTMKSVQTAAPGKIEVAEIERPVPGPRDVLPIDLGAMLRSEMTIIASQGYPTEIFEVTPDIAEYEHRFSRLISHRVPFSDADRAFQLALTPGAAEKVVVTFDD